MGVDIGHDRKLRHHLYRLSRRRRPDWQRADLPGCRWYPGRRPKNAHRTGRHAGRDRDNAVL